MRFMPILAAMLALGLAACGPVADEPLPGTPESPLGPDQVGGTPHPLEVDVGSR